MLFKPWLEASNITLFNFNSLNRCNILCIFKGSIDVFFVCKFIFFDKTPKVPIDAAFILFKDNI